MKPYSLANPLRKKAYALGCKDAEKNPTKTLRDAYEDAHILALGYMQDVPQEQRIDVHAFANSYYCGFKTIKEQQEAERLRRERLYHEKTAKDMSFEQMLEYADKLLKS